MLARVLARGAAPSLQHFYFDTSESNEDDLISIAGMIEARAREICQNAHTFYTDTARDKGQIHQALCTAGFFQSVQESPDITVAQHKPFQIP